MSDPSDRGRHGDRHDDGRGDAPGPRVLTMETSAEAVARHAEGLTPQIIETAQSGRIVPAAPTGPQLAQPARPRGSPNDLAAGRGRPDCPD